MDILDRDALANNYKPFMEVNGYLYPKHIQEIIGSAIEEYLKTGYVTQASLVHQVFSLINAYKVDPYKKYVKSIEDIYGLGINIAFVGPGFYPVEAIYASQQQQLMGKGTTTIYEPYLMRKELNPLIVKRDFFGVHTDLSNIDLVAARDSKEAAPVIIKTCNINRVPYYQWISSSLPEGMKIENTKQWHDLLIEESEEPKDPDREVFCEYIDGQFSIRSYYKRKRLLN